MPVGAFGDDGVVEACAVEHHKVFLECHPFVILCHDAVLLLVHHHHAALRALVLNLTLLVCDGVERHIHAVIDLLSAQRGHVKVECEHHLAVLLGHGSRFQILIIFAVGVERMACRHKLGCGNMLALSLLCCISCLVACFGGLPACLFLSSCSLFCGFLCSLGSSLSFLCCFACFLNLVLCGHSLPFALSEGCEREEQHYCEKQFLHVF